jgi:ribosomal protein S18 acetylase RimI-like enzyme
MRTVERLLLAGAVEVHPERPNAAAARYCLAQYFEELARRFEFGFDPAKSIHATANDFAPPKGHFVVARLHGNPIGCGALLWHSNYAYLKRMWVAESSRGLGVGSRILQALEALSAKGGQRVVRLETNKALVEAQNLYRRSGYREVRPFNAEPYADHWFEKRLPKGKP